MNSFAGLMLVIASKTNLKVQGVSIIDVKWTNMRDSASHILLKKITGSVTSAHQVNIKSQISDCCVSKSQPHKVFEIECLISSPKTAWFIAINLYLNSG